MTFPSLVSLALGLLSTQALAGEADAEASEDNSESTSEPEQVATTATVAPVDDPKLPVPMGSPEATGRRFPQVAPFATFVGGLAVDIVDNRDDESDNRQNRVWSPAIARLGMAGKLSDNFTFESEVEFNGGPFGTSVWEGQAAIQVRNQLIRYRLENLPGENDAFTVEVGRITDPASVDFTSFHIANLLLSDPFARFPMLVRGFNRGNGVRAEYAAFDGRFHVGATVNAGNPTSTTATIAMGGTFPPFERYYQVPWSVVGRDARGFPAENFNNTMVSPSVRWTSKYLQAQFETQHFWANTNTNTDTDDILRGFNMRGGVRGVFWSGGQERVAVFGNFGRMLNDVVELDDLARRSDEKFLSISGGGGLDVYFHGRSGIGVQYDIVREEQRGLSPTFQHFLNVGGTLFVHDSVFLSLRGVYFKRCEETEDLEFCDVDGRTQVMLTATAILGPTGDVQP